MLIPQALNVDLSDLTSSLVPFPTLHFLLPALAPLSSSADLKYRPAKLDTLFSDAFAPHSQLTVGEPRRSTMLATGVLLERSLNPNLTLTITLTLFLNLILTPTLYPNPNLNPCPSPL